MKQSRLSHLASARIIPENQHPITRRNISPAALWVTDRLAEANFSACLVGGCLRDLLLNKIPKDFDVATDARPDQIRAVFKGNSREIGRRFRIVHVRSGRETIEVSTFRSNASLATLAGDQPAKLRRHIISKNNSYGTMSDDALRRDFTVNALYFEPMAGTLYDFTGAMEDLKSRRLRLIGDPKERYAEDPVRILRAARFIAKLDFSLDQETLRPITEFAPQLRLIPAARLFGEVCKLFLSGHGQSTLKVLQRLDLLAFLFPEFANGADEINLALLRGVLKNADNRLRKDALVSPKLLYATLLWPSYQSRLQLTNRTGARAYHRKVRDAVFNTLSAPQNQIAMTRRTGQSVRDIWIIQEQLIRSQPTFERACKWDKQAFSLACQFLTIRGIVENNKSLRASAVKWQKIYNGNGPAYSGAIRQNSNPTRPHSGAPTKSWRRARRHRNDSTGRLQP